VGLFFQNLSKGHDENKMFHGEFLSDTRLFLLCEYFIRIEFIEVIFVQIAQNTFKLHSEYQPTGDQP
jgi:hypothetical protein